MKMSSLLRRREGAGPDAHRVGTQRRALEPRGSLGILESGCRSGHLARGRLGWSPFIFAVIDQANVYLEFHSIPGSQAVHCQVA